MKGEGSAISGGYDMGQGEQILGVVSRSENTQKMWGSRW